jgi:hypothetical protein
VTIFFSPPAVMEERISVRRYGQAPNTPDLLWLVFRREWRGWAIRRPGRMDKHSLEITPASAGATLEEAKELAVLYLEYDGEMDKIGADPRFQRIQAAVAARWNEVQK